MAFADPGIRDNRHRRRLLAVFDGRVWLAETEMGSEDSAADGHIPADGDEYYSE